MKILDIIINRENNMYEHLSAMMNRIQITYNKIRGALRFMNVKKRKMIIESKIRGQINGFLLLIINHDQNVQKYFNEYE